MTDRTCPYDHTQLETGTDATTVDCTIRGADTARTARKCHTGLRAAQNLLDESEWHHQAGEAYH